MSALASTRFLQRVLWADAASCLATGAAQLLLVSWLAPLLRLPAVLLLATGAFLVGYAGVVAWLARRYPVSHAAVGLLIAGNLGWAAACLVLLASSAVAPSGLGMTWILAQAITVIALAELQWLGMRRAPRVTGWA